MRVLVTGAKWHDNSPAIVTDGFRAQGHTVEIFYDNAPHWTQTAAKILNRTPFKQSVQDCDEHYRRFVSAAFLEKVAALRPDFIFVIAGLRFEGAMIRRVRERYQIPVCNFVVDDPAFCSRTLLRDLGAYSAVFVIDKAWMPVVEFFNPHHVHYLPHAGDALHFKPLKGSKDIDIAFGGTMALRMPNGPAGYLRAVALNALAEAGFRITAYAGGITDTFKEFPALRGIEYYDGYKNHDELNALYNRAKIALSMHSPQLKQGVSPRVFDIALSGTFQIAEYKPDMPDLFADTVPCFRNPEELVRLARYYCDHHDEREEKARAAYDIAGSRHLFKHRVSDIMRVLKV